MNDEYTVIELDGGEKVFVCNNCGASTFFGPEQIDHHSSCKPGESKYWEEFYAQADDDDDDNYEPHDDFEALANRGFE